MTRPEPRKPDKSVPATSKSTMVKVAVIGASAGFVTAKLLDVALVGTGVAAAVGSAAFAGFMLMQGDHTPKINGMEYLAIFAQPSVGAKPPAPDEPTSTGAIAVAQAPAAQPIDRAPVGAIDPAPKRATLDLEIVAAARDHAWVRSGAQILSIKPGDTIPDLGKVSAIAWMDGRWTLLGEDGKPMLALAAGQTAAPVKPLIFRPEGAR